LHLFFAGTEIRILWHLYSAGIACKIYFLMPSNFDEKNAIVFWGQYPRNFETKFFPFRFEGISYNSVSMEKGCKNHKETLCMLWINPMIIIGFPCNL
jgi:hypothetical protein